MSCARIPPSYLNLFPLLAVIFHFLIPIKILIPPPFTYLGILLIVLGLTLNIWSVRILREHQTTTEYNRAPSSLVMSGPFRLSRNPIYLSGVILLTGIAIFLGSLITFVFPILILLILEIIYIPSEEEILGNTFSDEYRSYKQKVRRWL